MAPVRPPAPAGLGAAGSELWTSLTAAFEFEPVELFVLSASCRQADAIAALEKMVGEDGMVTTGSRGQERLSSAVAEARMGRLALARLLSELRIPEEDEQVGQSSASRRARHAAATRWAREREVRDARG
jgi:hypothetical protein